MAALTRAKTETQLSHPLPDEAANEVARRSRMRSESQDAASAGQEESALVGAEHQHDGVAKIGRLRSNFCAVGGREDLNPDARAESDDRA
ncbi:MAG: hypothetical protein WA988_10390 [Candidatus Nanopelagicales bacterium]